MHLSYYAIHHLGAQCWINWGANPIEGSHLAGAFTTLEQKAAKKLSRPGNTYLIIVDPSLPCYPTTILSTFRMDEDDTKDELAAT